MASEKSKGAAGSPARQRLGAGDRVSPSPRRKPPGAPKSRAGDRGARKDPELEMSATRRELRDVKAALDEHSIVAMGISLKTVDVHRANLKAKLHLAHMTDLVHYAVRWMGGQHLG